MHNITNSVVSISRHTTHAGSCPHAALADRLETETSFYLMLNLLDLGFMLYTLCNDKDDTQRRTRLARLYTTNNI